MTEPYGIFCPMYPDPIAQDRESRTTLFLTWLQPSLCMASSSVVIGVFHSILSTNQPKDIKS